MINIDNMNDVKLMISEHIPSTKPIKPRLLPFVFLDLIPKAIASPAVNKLKNGTYNEQKPRTKATIPFFLLSILITT